uniref:Ketimine reductase mu-crystallin n=1 Tax=Biomphalaria glabrata TaxID=6526 RepID=A0A2C9JFG1_BIOGL
MDTLVIVSSEKVTDILDYTILIPAIEKSLAEFSKRTGVIQPVRNVVLIPESEGFLGCMPVYSREDDILATKIVSFFPQNKDVSTHHAVILVFCAHTGIPKALLDGDVITAKRTAATSAVATKYLVNGKPDVLALLGSGVQARSHVAALCELFTFKEIRIWNHRFDGAVKLAKEIGLNCAACRDVSEAVKNADVIVTVTSAKDPVLRLDWVKPGAHINESLFNFNNGSAFSKDYECSSGSFFSAEIYAEIGEVILGTREAMREKTTVFKSLGMAIEDGIAAKLVINKLGIE